MTLRVEPGNLPAIGEWVAEHCPCDWNPQKDVAIGVVDDDLWGTPEWVRGGAIYTMNTGPGGSIWVHFAGRDPKWITHDMLWMAFDYPFNQCRVEYLYGVVEENNTRVLDLDLKFGYQITARLPGLFATGDGLVLSMRRDQCRWLRLKPRGFCQR